MCGCACIHTLICKFLQDKQKSQLCFLLEGMGEHQTNPTSASSIRQVLTVPCVPPASLPTPSLSMHTDPGLLSPQHRLLRSSRRNVFCQLESNQDVRKIAFSDTSEPALSLGHRAPAYSLESEKGLVTCDRGCI